MNNITGLRQPVAPLDASGKPLIIFPSACCANEIMGWYGCSRVQDAITNNKMCSKHYWKYMKVEEYKNQDVEKCYDILRIKKVKYKRI
jgi:hypothetical protein